MREREKLTKYFWRKKIVFDFLEETEEKDCEEKFWTKIEARCNISNLKRNFFIGLKLLLNKRLRV